jgi:hypothetical protein
MFEFQKRKAFTVGRSRLAWNFMKSSIRKGSNPRRLFPCGNVLKAWTWSVDGALLCRAVCSYGTSVEAVPTNQQCRVRRRAAGYVVVVVRYAPAFPRRQRNANGQSVRRHGTAPHGTQHVEERTGRRRGSWNAVAALPCRSISPH